MLSPPLSFFISSHSIISKDGHTYGKKFPAVQAEEEAFGDIQCLGVNDYFLFLLSHMNSWVVTGVDKGARRDGLQDHAVDRG